MYLGRSAGTLILRMEGVLYRQESGPFLVRPLANRRKAEVYCRVDRFLRLRRSSNGVKATVERHIA